MKKEPPAGPDGFFVSLDGECAGADATARNGTSCHLASEFAFDRDTRICYNNKSAARP
ncbi:hypothetical protein [Edaphobacter modestus]|uniref:Uncharacterized protein n=1 Tax=Edaphobacter modestus TaxID=388466 RepID=A0A4Q7Z026_9BACT|nr:hypothetical protein [Edaphobacter modestus]RZU43557.1 hypothetical protein BDD14_5227 [Edaphobacter modestus]